MLCDKCKKKCTGNWVPGESYPQYEIVERTGVVGDCAPINLCYECSIKFKQWLEQKDGDGK